MSAQRIDTAALLKRTNLADIVERFIPLSPTGSEFQAICPFHADSRPSLRVIPAKGFCYCHACNWWGDAIDFVMEFTGQPFREAVAAIDSGAVPNSIAQPQRMTVTTGDAWRPVIPAPAAAPDMDFTDLWNPKRDRSTAFRQAEVFVYRDAAGALLGYVLRVEFPDGKITPQLTYCSNTETGEQHWCLRSFPKPRPLYGLDQLAARPDAKVLIVEGERCKDVGQKVFAGMVVVSWAGGTSGAKYADWSPLAGRECVLWPDNDDAGFAVMEEIAVTLAPITQGLRIVTLSGADKPKGWDVADATLKDRMTPEEIGVWARERIELWKPAAEPELSLEHFYAYMPSHQYIFTPTRELWPSASVNSRLRPPSDAPEKTANAWLDKNRAVSQMTWVPGEPLVIHDRIIANGGWSDHPGASCFNLYLPPSANHGDATKAGRWLDHLRSIYPESADHIIKWMAHRVQRPSEKINHGLVLGGAPGMGKDTLIEPLKHAVGPWNFNEVSPSHLLGRFNGFVKSVVLRVSEARDLGDVDRFAFYDHTKIYMASPPDVLRCDEKNLREHAVVNCCGVIITTNHKTDGIYLPADDRRHYVAWSDLNKDNFTEGYWNNIWQWYEHGGLSHVAAYLGMLDLSSFNAKAPPPKTAAFYAIVDANRAPEDADLADILEFSGAPKAITLNTLIEAAKSHHRVAFVEWLQDRKNRRAVPYRLEAAGYAPVRNDIAKDGLWKINDRRQAAYAQSCLSVRDRIEAVTTMIKQLPAL